MNDGDSIHELLSGRRRGIWPTALRGLLSAAEPFFRGAVAMRNWCYDRGVFRSNRIQAPVISVGNITAGGTGKTPVVRWLASRLRGLGFHPAILMRGYMRVGGVSDEEDLLRATLSDAPPVIVHARPDRAAGAAEVLQGHPETDIFILDDGFQHRRLHRDFDLVLIDATAPFGYGHLHPRGLLREPTSALKRADAFVLTRSDLIDEAHRSVLEETLRGMNHLAPVYRTRHVLTGLRSASLSAAASPDLPIEALARHPFYAVAGIANPAALHRQLSAFGDRYRGHRWYADHHEYTAGDIDHIRSEAKAAGADIIIATEKDWRKLRRFANATEPGARIHRLELSVHFLPPGEDGLLELIRTRLETSRASGLQ